MAIDGQALEQELGDTLRETGIRDFVYGEYHPSEITGCPLKEVLNKMTDKKTKLNAWLFQGSAVHYYLQEHPSPNGMEGIVTEALYDVGCHPMYTSYEVTKRYPLGNGACITGTCDILTSDGEDRIILDLKYSSVSPSTHKGRVLKYLSQVNCYSSMFDADQHGLVLINHKAGKRGNAPETIPDGITVVTGDPQEENWELVKQKARTMHKVLGIFGYDKGKRWDAKMLEEADLDFWEELFEFLSVDNCPSYDKECRYCDHKDYCPVENGDIGSGLNKFKGGYNG